MNSENDASLEELVALENARVHDSCAIHHDRNVPYINRNATREYYWALITEQLKRNKRKFVNSDVCELGCGTGTFVDLALLNKANAYVGVDVSSKMIELAEAKHAKKNVRFLVDTLDHFSTQFSNSFDIILSSSFIHHLVDLNKSMDQIKALLKPTGIYIGLHEPIVPKMVTTIEHLDFFLQILNGRAFGEMNVFKRLMLLACGFWRKNEIGEIEPYLDILSLYRNAKGIITRGKIVKNQKSDTNYVDFQLNREFSLQRHLNGRGEIIPYTYLCYKDLFPAAKVNNYEMFILTRN